jgi:hypothetical protein
MASRRGASRLRPLSLPVALLLSLAAPLLASASSPAAPAARSATYDARSFLLDGERALILSGSIHYQRVLRADWPRALALAAEAGFNAVQTYVLWDIHEPERGRISFEGNNDIAAFAAEAAALGLRLDVRVGPYICGEHFNGGVPIWMRADESGAACFRCSDAAWENFTVHVLSSVVGELRRAGALWTQGGPVYLLQVENEYGGGDVEYLKFCVAAARNETTDVPWLLCHDEDLCARVNEGSASPLGDALCTINGFWEDDSAEGDQQPSPAFVAAQRKNNPGQPTVWTEDQGWFDQWGDGQRVRRTSDILYGVARAISLGFTHHNFYMLTGGSNFGYSAAWGVTTAYAPDTAIDFLLLRHEPKYSTVKAFNVALTSISVELLSHEASAPTPVGRNCEVATFGSIIFVSNKGLNSSAAEIVTVPGLGAVDMPNHTVAIFQGGALVFNTSAAPDALPTPPAISPSPAAAPAPRLSPPAWTTLVEQLGFGNSTAAPAAGAPPLEMLALTRNEVDYMYYSLNVTTAVNASSLAVSTCGGEYVYVFAGGAQLARDAAAADAAAQPPRSRHSFALPGGALRAQTALHVLVSAMGLSTSPSPTSCKGVRHVAAGKTDLTNAGWRSSWVFAGEAAQVYTPAGAAAAQWQPVAADGGSVPTSWFRASFDLPPAPPAAFDVPPGAPPQLAYALDLAGATKGVAWVNGFNIGRYDLELGVCNGPCAPPIHGGQCYIFWRNCGQPTQRFYHVPSSLLLPANNLVVLFEEASTVPVSGQGPVAPSPPPAPAGVAGAAATHGAALGGSARNLSTVALVALTAHP